MKLLALPLTASLALLTALLTHADTPLPAGVTRVPVVFSEGHETDGRDHGRPIVLIAAALGVTDDIFRNAFSHVHPAGPGKRPDEAEARANKSALMSALGKHGITNDRLDEVSNYYRYVRSNDELWTNKPAKANALVKNGVVTGYEVTDPGAGYSSAPVVTVPGVSSAPAKVELAYGKQLKTNGSIAKITLPDAK